MLNARKLLIAAGLAFGAWEALDSLRIDVPAFALLFSALFLACTAWFWRRASGRAAVALLVLFAFEVAEAPTWKHTATTTKAVAIALGAIGIAAAIGVLAGGVRKTRRQASSSATTSSSAAST